MNNQSHVKLNKDMKGTSYKFIKYMGSFDTWNKDNNLSIKLNSITFLIKLGGIS